MRRTLLLLTLLCAALSGRSQYFPPNGITTFPGGSSGLINLTTASHPTSPPYVGSIWSTSAINFNQSFKMDFDASFDRPSTIGGEGMALVFGNNITPVSLNAADMFLGYYADPSGTVNPDFYQSIGIEIDTHNDFLTPPYADDNSTLNDHIMIAANGAFDAAHVLAPPVSITGGSIKDGLFHHYTVNWDACNNLITVYFDGRKITGALIPAGIYLPNPYSVNWGFTGSIGRDGNYSNENIKNVVVTPLTCTTNPYCTRPCPSMAPLTVTGTNGSPCMFHCTSTVLPSPTCWTSEIFQWSVTTPAGTVTHNHLTTSGTDADDLPIPSGMGGTISLTVTFSDGSGLGHFCTSTPVTHVDGCNGGIATRMGETENAQQIGTDDNSIKIYPNPTLDKITVTAANENIEHIQVFDITGKLLWEQQYNKADHATILLGKFAPGSYIVKVNNNIRRLITKQQ